MHYVYILYSEKINKYYIGETHNIQLRIQRHDSEYYDNKWTAKGKPWKLFHQIDCQSKSQALKIERHIKRMKSRKYIENLVKYPEITKKLLSLYLH